MNDKYHKTVNGKTVATNLINNCIHEFTLDRFNKPTQCSKCGLFYEDIIDKSIKNYKLNK